MGPMSVQTPRLRRARGEIMPQVVSGSSRRPETFCSSIASWLPLMVS